MSKRRKFSAEFKRGAVDALKFAQLHHVQVCIRGMHAKRARSQRAADDGIDRCQSRIELQGERINAISMLPARH
jgi:hypothetical protein